MLGSIRRSIPWAVAVVVVLGASASCTDTVYRDSGNLRPPPENASGFLGYSQEDSKTAVCGNCHVSHQQDWEKTKHASAWEDLQASGGAQALCEGCHTVNERGNVATEPGGFSTTKDTRYHDVQCESCHGPGLDHVQAPDASTPPLAPLKVDTMLTYGCGECHNGFHHPFVEEWAQSGHGRMTAWHAEDPSPGPQTNANCQPCHTGQGALKAWGVQSNYLEKDYAHGDTLQITCGVCHDPHSIDASGENGGTGGQLRYRVDARTEEENLCAKCHHKRGTPDPTTFRGPHSPEGPLVLGYAGWWPPNMQLRDTLVATHGSEANPRLCATCHVSRFAVNDPNSGDLTFQVTGHLFVAIPCIDPATGKPTSGDCAMSQRTFQACAGSGCHGTEDVARSAMLVAEQRITADLVTLRAMLMSLPCSEFNSKDGNYKSAEGARFNYQLAAEPDETPAGECPQTSGLPAPVARPSSTVHNPFLTEALVLGSIQQLRIDYGLTVSASIDSDIRTRLPSLTKSSLKQH